MRKDIKIPTNASSSSSSSSNSGSTIATSSATDHSASRLRPHAETSDKLTFSTLPLISEERKSGDEDMISFQVNLHPQPLPPSLHQFCEDTELDKAVVVEHILIDAYRQILRDLSEEKVARELFKQFLRTSYILGRISSENLERAKLHGWLEEPDIERFNRVKENYPELSDEPNDA